MESIEQIGERIQPLPRIKYKQIRCLGRLQRHQPHNAFPKGGGSHPSLDPDVNATSPSASGLYIPYMQKATPLRQNDETLDDPSEVARDDREIRIPDFLLENPIEPQVPVNPIATPFANRPIIPQLDDADVANRNMGGTRDGERNEDIAGRDAHLYAYPDERDGAWHQALAPFPRWGWGNLGNERDGFDRQPNPLNNPGQIRPRIPAHPFINPIPNQPAHAPIERIQNAEPERFVDAHLLGERWDQEAGNLFMHRASLVPRERMQNADHEPERFADEVLSDLDEDTIRYLTSPNNGHPNNNDIAAQRRIFRLIELRNERLAGNNRFSVLGSPQQNANQPGRAYNRAPEFELPEFALSVHNSNNPISVQNETHTNDTVTTYKKIVAELKKHGKYTEKFSRQYISEVRSEIINDIANWKTEEYRDLDRRRLRKAAYQQIAADFESRGAENQCFSSGKDTQLHSRQRLEAVLTEILNNILTTTKYQNLNRADIADMLTEILNYSESIGATQYRDLQGLLQNPMSDEEFQAEKRRIDSRETVAIEEADEMLARGPRSAFQVETFDDIHPRNALINTRKALIILGENANKRNNSLIRDPDQRTRDVRTALNQLVYGLLAVTEGDGFCSTGKKVQVVKAYEDYAGANEISQGYVDGAVFGFIFNQKKHTDFLKFFEDEKNRDFNNKHRLGTFIIEQYNNDLPLEMVKNYLDRYCPTEEAWTIITDQFKPPQPPPEEPQPVHQGKRGRNISTNSNETERNGPLARRPFYR
jgi:metal-responsive CopG/Arc/MetJ family transcriptional regulator